ncbi:glycoside hydrolase family 43 protein [Streptococcus plurextorum]|uniref:glycoside hydrolase family 43 protein n=1 Tax=Streptococcus plurextorum TaxID=456876 RepID=UPI00041944D3|nr:glycoside hydrolase family 43 protein [Streptococcus plurextorum]
MTVTLYQNPTLRGMFPDPSIVRVDDTFFMVNSTFEYYPGIALSTSKDLMNWTRLPGIAQTPLQADLRQAQSNEGIFAACIRYHLGYFYVITTNFAEFKNFVIRGTLSSDGTSIIWEDKRTEIDIFGIDPDLYFEDGRTYVQFTGYIDDKGTKAIQQVEIDLTSGNILAGPRVLSFGSGGRDVEGPHLIKRDEWYYLLAAEGGTGQGHMITMFRSQSLWGPFEGAPTNPLFTNRDRAMEALQNIGHADIFQDTNGNWWLTCLGTRPATINHTQLTTIGRETLLYPVDWSGDWPLIYNGIPTETVDLSHFPHHAKTLSPQIISAFVDTFTSHSLHPEWLTLRSNLDNRLSLTTGKLYLKGSPVQLSDLGTPSFIGLRQTEHHESLVLDINPTDTKVNTGSFGIAVIIDSSHYGALLVEKSDIGYDIFKKVQVLDLHIHEKVATLPNLPNQLCVEHGTDFKRFTAKDVNTTVTFDLHAQHFSNEAIAALNTGNIAGLYVLGDAEVSLKKAYRGKLGKRNASNNHQIS